MRSSAHQAGRHARTDPALRRWFGALLAAVFAGVLLPVQLALPAAAQLAAGAVTLSVLDVNPNSPTLSHEPKSLRISLALTNSTAQPVKDVIVSGVRADPIDSQAALEAAFAKPKTPSGPLEQAFATTHDISLPARTTKGFTFTVKSDIPTDSSLCLCANAIYPLYFSAQYAPSDGTATIVATAQTYVPSFNDKPHPPVKARVGWLWPLLDRPHRSTSDTVFTDDELAGEVAPGGRLARLLEVVSKVAGSVPMTIVTDPDLIDELAVMSGPDGYRVDTATGPPVAGTGSGAARDWLTTLRTLLADHPKLEIAFTPVADPAVESLHHNKMTWAVGLDNPAQARVTAALGGATPLSDIAWPANETISSGALATLTAQGTKTVVVNDSTLTGGRADVIVPDALAPLATGAGSVVAAVTSAPIERQVAAVFATSGKRVHGLAALPQLVAEVALRVDLSLDVSHYVLITPPRDLDVADPKVAERAIKATSVSPWSQPLALRAATSVIKPVSHGILHPSGAPRLSSDTLDAVRYMTSASRALAGLYVNPTDAPQYYPIAVQRCETTALLASPRLATRCVQRLADSIRSGILDKVTLVQPHSSGSTTMGSYTFASQNSTLPVTVVNGIGKQIRITLEVSAIPAAGFTAPEQTVKLDPSSKTQIKMKTNIDHPGRFAVRVSISTPDGLALGDPISLSVRSTALGTIGVVITVVAAIVLVLALLVRFTRRVARRDRPRPDGSPSAEPSRVSAAPEKP